MIKRDNTKQYFVQFYALGYDGNEHQVEMPITIDVVEDIMRRLGLYQILKYDEYRDDKLFETFNTLIDLDEYVRQELRVLWFDTKARKKVL